MKKTTLFLLVIVLILGLALPAHAADKPDSRLAKVTLAVKHHRHKRQLREFQRYPVRGPLFTLLVPELV